MGENTTSSAALLCFSVIRRWRDSDNEGEK
jgi:hypothetical protein